MTKDNKKCFYCVEYDNYTGNGFVRDLYFDSNDTRIKKECGDIYVFTDKNLGLSRVLYADKKTADNVLLEMIND